MTFYRAFLLLPVLLGIVVLSSEAQAQELVLNGGFESGTTLPADGWGEAIVGSAFSFIGSEPGDAHSGSNGLLSGPLTGSLYTISQTLTTVPGTFYSFSYWLANGDEAFVNSFSATWDGTEVQNFTNTALFDYTLFSQNVLATSNATTITFSFMNDESFWQLDDVSVTAAAAAPEPSTLSLAALALGSVGLVRRRSTRR